MKPRSLTVKIKLDFSFKKAKLSQENRMIKNVV